MFQGVASELGKRSHGKDVRYNQIEVKDLLVRLFSVRNIIIHIFIMNMIIMFS